MDTAQAAPAFYTLSPLNAVQLIGEPKSYLQLSYKSIWEI